MLSLKKISYIVILTLCFSLSSCATLQKKFVRKKKAEEKKRTVIVTTKNYSEDVTAEDLYKNRFYFWKTWHMDLVRNIDASHKKRILCFDNTIKNLTQLKEYLDEKKSTELDNIIKKLASLEPVIKKNMRLSQTESNRLTRTLEQTQRQIEQGFSYLRVKDSLSSDLSSLP